MRSDHRRLPWLDDVARDLRHGSRALRRNPTFTAAALLTLAIGIGANTAVFSVVDGVLLKPLPYPNAEELVAVWHAAPGAAGLSTVSGDLRLSPSMYFTYAEHNRTFQNIGVWGTGSVTITGSGEPEHVRAVTVSDGVLQALGVQPLLGRWLSEGDQMPGSPPAVLLTYGYWQRRFGADPHVIGRPLIVDSAPREIVGVMPQGFTVVNTAADLIGAARFDRSRLTLPGFGWQAIARLKPGVTLADADADVARMVPIWMGSWPAGGGYSPRVYEGWHIAPALRSLKQDVVGNLSKTLWVLMGTIGIVMFIACANVATLLLVRADARQQELAVRAALGAGRGRIVRAMLLESMVLACAGGILGLGLGSVGLRVLLAQVPSTVPRLNDISIDLRALGFNVIVSLLSGIVFGVIPALRQASAPLAVRLGAGGRTSGPTRSQHQARNILVVVQLALALVLLVSAGLMIRTFRALHAVQPGFSEAAQLQTLRVSIPASLVPEAERVGRLQHEIREKLAAVAGVESAAFASALAMEGLPPDWDAIRAEDKAYGADEAPPLRLFKSVSPDFFESAGTRLIAGRDYSWTDMYERRPFLIISENLARELWGTPPAAIGKRIQTGPASPWREVIAVVQDVYDNGVDQPAPATVYWPAIGESPYRAGPLSVSRTVTFIVRTPRAGTSSFRTEVQQAVWSANPSLSLASVQTLQEIYERSMARTSFTLIMLAIAGAMALTLGIVGIYGVIAYGVSQRQREIGIRLALGAHRREITQMFVRGGLLLAAIGVPLGLGASAAVTRLLSSLLFGISPLDPMTYLTVTFILVTAVTAASYLPARRATAVNPIEVLKVD